MDAEALFQQALAYSAEMAGQYGYVVEEDLAVRTLNRAVVTPRRYFANRSYTGAVYDGSGALVQSTLRFNVQDIVPVDPPVLPALEAIAALDRHHEQAIYGGILFPILGHFCFETLGRFWPLVTLARRAREGGRAVPLCFHHWPGLDVAAFFQTPFYQFVFERFGIGRADVVIIDRPMSFGTLVVPDAASIYHVKLSTEMRRVFDFVAAAPDGRLATGRGRRMAYLSRSRWTDNRRVSNEMELEAELARRGFEIVHTQGPGPACAAGPAAGHGHAADHRRVARAPRRVLPARRAVGDAGHAAGADADRDREAARDRLGAHPALPRSAVHQRPAQ